MLKEKNMMWPTHSLEYFHLLFSTKNNPNKKKIISNWMLNFPLINPNMTAFFLHQNTAMLKYQNRNNNLWYIVAVSFERLISFISSLFWTLSTLLLLLCVKDNFQSCQSHNRSTNANYFMTMCDTKFESTHRWHR